MLTIRSWVDYRATNLNDAAIAILSVLFLQVRKSIRKRLSKAGTHNADGINGDEVQISWYCEDILSLNKSSHASTPVLLKKEKG